jgi:hypothetical protein
MNELPRCRCCNTIIEPRKGWLANLIDKALQLCVLCKDKFDNDLREQRCGKSS